MEWFLIYLFVMVEQIKDLLSYGFSPMWWALIAFGVVTSIGAVSILIEEDTSIWDSKWCKSVRKWTLGLAILFCTIGVIGKLVPDQKVWRLS